MRIFGPGRPLPIMLGESIRDRRLPRSKIQLLPLAARLFYRGLQLAVEVKLRDLAGHRTEQCKIPRMRLDGIVPHRIPSIAIHAKRRLADRAVTESIEKELCEAVVASRLRNP